MGMQVSSGETGSLQNGERAAILRAALLACAPGRAHSLGGVSPLHTRQGEVLAERQGCPSLSVLSTCVTKQTKDLRYRDVEPLWFLSFGLTHDDAVCPGKRVVSWINVCNFYRATKRKKCPFQSSAASSECRGQLAIDGSIATKRVGPKGC
jgi:hypothetical protein